MLKKLAAALIRKIVSLGAVPTILACAAFGEDAPRTVKTSVRPDLLAQVETELARLKAQAGQEPGPEWPRPSTRVAYLLLAGLAEQGSAMDPLPQPEQQFFGVEKRGGVQGKLFEVNADARVALVDRWIQDKSGTYVGRGAELYVRQAGKWTRKGSGTAIGKD